jgi:hypothetical protein
MDKRYNPEDVVITFNEKDVTVNRDAQTGIVQIIRKSDGETLFTDYDNMIKRDSNGTVLVDSKGMIVAGYKADNWAHPLAQCAFQDVLQSWNHSEIGGSDTFDVVQWGDWSFPVPGLTNFKNKDPLEHSSHPDGNCVDIRPFVNNQAQDRNTQYTDSNYLSENSAKFLALAISRGAYTVYFCDTSINKNVATEVEKLVKEFKETPDFENLKDGLKNIKVETMRDHENHFHVCFATDGKPERTSAFSNKWPKEVKEASYQRTQNACLNLWKKNRRYFLE